MLQKHRKQNHKPKPMDNNYFNEETIAWLRRRLGRFTASEIHKLFVKSRTKGEIFGQGAETYIMTKAAELLTMEVKEDVDFKQGEWGKANERDGVLEMESMLGFQGIHYGMFKPEFFEYGKFAGCSPDWEFTHKEGWMIGADVKCPYNSAEHVRNLLLKSAEELKEERWEYYCQLQMSMIVRGWRLAYFFSYDPRAIEHILRVHLIKVYPDEVWAKEFHERLAGAVERLNEIISILEPQTA